MRSPCRRRLLFVLVLCLLLLTVLLLGGRRRSSFGPTLHGIYVVPSVIHEGETARAYVSTLQDQVTLTILDVNRTVVHTATVDGSAQPTSAQPHLGAGWSRSVPLPDLPPGAYAVAVPAVSIPTEERAFTGGLTFESPLNVRPTTPSAEVLFLVSSGTQQGYNRFGGVSYYTDPPGDTVGRRRPGWNRNTLTLSRLTPLVAGQGLGWEVADSDYVEDHPEVLAHYRLVVMVGKWEYVTRAFRAAMEGYVAGGGRLLAIGNEFSSIQDRRVQDVRTCYKFPHRGPDPVLTDADPTNDQLATYEWARVGEPESGLFGVTYWLGGWPGYATAWKVHRASHWLWLGTGLQEGDSLASIRAGEYVDGTLVRFVNGLPYADQTGLTETPDDFLVLAEVPTVNARPWWCWIDGTPKFQCEQQGWGVIGIRQNANGGIVLVIPDSDWLRDTKWLAYPEVPQITQNAIAVLGAPEPVDAHAGYATTPP